MINMKLAYNEKCHFCDKPIIVTGYEYDVSQTCQSCLKWVCQDCHNKFRKFTGNIITVETPCKDFCPVERLKTTDFNIQESECLKYNQKYNCIHNGVIIL